MVEHLVMIKGSAGLAPGYGHRIWRDVAEGDVLWWIQGCKTKGTNGDQKIRQVCRSNTHEGNREIWMRNNTSFTSACIPTVWTLYFPTSGNPFHVFRSHFQQSTQVAVPLFTFTTSLPSLPRPIILLQFGYIYHHPYIYLAEFLLTWVTFLSPSPTWFHMPIILSSSGSTHHLPHSVSIPLLPSSSPPCSICLMYFFSYLFPPITHWPLSQQSPFPTLSICPLTPTTSDPTHHLPALIYIWAHHNLSDSIINSPTLMNLHFLSDATRIGHLCSPLLHFPSSLPPPPAFYFFHLYILTCSGHPLGLYDMTQTSQH